MTRHEEALIEVQEVLKRYRPLFKELHDLGMPLFTVEPPFPEDKVRAVQAAQDRLAPVEQEFHKKLRRLLQIADEERIDLISLLKSLEE